MVDWIAKLMDGSYMPHGHCLAWQPDLLFMHVGSDILITIAYFSIPATLTLVALKRPDFKLNRFFVLFSLFIFGCGTTHIIETINIWHGFYYIEGIVKTLTAAVSVLTAIAIWPMLPKLLNLPSFEQLEQANRELKQEVERRQQAELALSNMNRTLESTVQLRTMALERSNEALTEFVYVASHDLRAPLRGINNYAKFLDEDSGELLTEESKSYLRGIQDLATRMGLLLQSLLQYARIDGNNEELESVDIRTLLQRAASRFHGDPTVTIELPDTSGEIRCIPLQFTEMLANLFDNAIKYNVKEEKRIRVELEQKGDEWLIKVRDNGIGIPAEHHESIFKFFNRLHGNDEYGGGSGAGLAIVKKVIERIGGRIGVESGRDEGTCFSLHLPYASA